MRRVVRGLGAPAGAAVGVVTDRAAPGVTASIGVAGLRVTWCAGTASVRSGRVPAADLIVLVDEAPGSAAALDHITATTAIPVLAVIAGSHRGRGVDLLERGADDFVTTSSTAEELAARVRTVLRRAGKAPPELPTAEELRLGDLVVHPSRGAVSVDGTAVGLTRRELELLAFLLAHHERAWSPGELLERVWGYRHGDANTVAVHVCHLRRKLGDDVRAPRYIVTVPGRGYRAGPGVRR